jgi:hypothetical protein
MKVKCKACEHVWDSKAKSENITAGKINCKQCQETDLEILEVTPPVPPPGKGIEQLQNEGDEARRGQVDKKNTDDAAREDAALKELEGKPLTGEERAFCEKIAAKMNCGRPVEAPSAADVLRYSKLKGRLEVKDESGGE